MNPFFEKYTTKYESIPYSKIENKHFIPAFSEGIKIAESEIQTICDNSENPSFLNTIEALEKSGEMLTRTAKAFFNLSGAHTSEEIQKIAQEVSPLLTKFSNDKILNETLFKKIKQVFENQEKFNLNGEQKRLLELMHNDYVRNGANLNTADKNILREIDTKLSKLSLVFGENGLKEINDYEMHITDENDLSGLPNGVKEAAALTAKQKDKDGWIFTLNAPSAGPFMTYADSRKLRMELHKAMTSTGCKGNENDNREIIKEIVSLRSKRAQLLGYKTHADFVLEKTMATKPQTVFNFIEDLLQKAKPYAQDEYKELCEFSKSIGGPETVMPYDASYYVEKLKKEKFDLSQEDLKPYFKLENVIDGVFKVAEKLYGLQFQEIFDIDLYHKDVKTYKVTDENNEFVSLFYADFFPRNSKQNGAWMNSFKSQSINNGINSRPHIVNVCNFTKPTDTKPSLLTFYEVVTLFHEFGHGLHGMLSNVQYESLSGTGVYRDFVELPSQMLENWCFEKEALSLFAFHYETGEVIPDSLIQKIKESSNFREASAIMRQLSFASLDMAYHTENPENITDIKLFEKQQMKATHIGETVDYACFSTGFGHIFAGGYSAGYYSYKWAEVLDADTFEYFKEKGIFSREIGEKFKETILSKGGTKHPMDLYKDFRGVEPDTTALLKRAGLLEMV